MMMAVLEVHHATLAVGEASVIEHLQQDVEHVGMGLLHLIEQHHAVGVAAHGLGQLAALVVAHVSRRRSDQALHGELLHVLGHVDAHHGLLGIEQVLGQRLGQLGLAHAGGAEEQERADGTVRVGKSRAVAADGTGHRSHGLVLADDAALAALPPGRRAFPSRPASSWPRGCPSRRPQRRRSRLRKPPPSGWRRPAASSSRLPRPRAAAAAARGMRE